MSFDYASLIKKCLYLKKKYLKILEKYKIYSYIEYCYLINSYKQHTRVINIIEIYFTFLISIFFFNYY